MDNQQPSTNYRSIKKNALKYIVSIGEIYGVYKVLSEEKVQTSKCTEVRYRCVNINSGQEYLKRGRELYRIRDRVNNKFQNKRQEGLRRYLYRNYMNNARKRKHDFSLSFEEFDNLISQPCYYCGEPPKEVDKEFLCKRGDRFQPNITVNGIDRKNPLIGYQLDNCVPCCPTCNYMKHVSTESEFLSQIKKIYTFKISKGSTTIPRRSTSQANGDGNGKPLTDNAEGKDIVSTL